ncbi:hypothetical protein D3C76_675480 [compost metagenome]
MPELTESDVRWRLKRHIREQYRTQGAYARAYGCSDAYLSAICCGDKPIPEPMLMDIGVVRRVVTTYALTEDVKP